MPIKLISHRRKLLRKNAYISPHQRHRHDERNLNRAERRKAKRLASSKKPKPAKKNKPRKDGIRLPYNYKYYQMKDNTLLQKNIEE